VLESNSMVEMSGCSCSCHTDGGYTVHAAPCCPYAGMSRSEWLPGYDLSNRPKPVLDTDLSSDPDPVPDPNPAA
jgi:hypothetical protein